MRAARILAVLLVVCLLTGCSAIDEVIEIPPDVVYPSIEPVQDAAPMDPATLSWQFEGSEVHISVPVDAAVYQGAKKAQKSALFFTEKDELEWIPEYYRAFVDEPHQEPLYDSMLLSFRELRGTLKLDDDRYAELIVSAIQSLTYRTDPVSLEPKFPIETVGDGDGDCDDKTLLAAALLAREGYDVAILLFSAEQHVTLGIRGNGPPFGNSGYTLVEMTTPTLFGWLPDSLNGGDVTLDSEPMVIEIGDGAKAYTAGDQVEAIRATYKASVAAAEELDDRIKQQFEEVERIRSQAEKSRIELERLAAARDVPEYNARVPGYNALVTAYDEAVEAYNALVAEQKREVETARRIFESHTDRYGLARWLNIGS